MRCWLFFQSVKSLSFSVCPKTQHCVHQSLYNNYNYMYGQVVIVHATTVLCRIAKLDSRIGTCTVLACNKWQPIFTECEASLGFTGDAANDSFAAWSRLASNSVQRRKRFSVDSRRSNSLDAVTRRTVRVPVELIPLERARTMTALEGNGAHIRLELSLARSGGLSRHLSLSNSALHSSSSSSTLALHHNISSSMEILDISRPIQLEKSLSYSPQTNQLSVPPRNTSPYAPQADTSPHSSPGSSEKERPHSAPEDEASMRIGDGLHQPLDTQSEIQRYLDRVRLCMVV